MFSSAIRLPASPYPFCRFDVTGDLKRTTIYEDIIQSVGSETELLGSVGRAASNRTLHVWYSVKVILGNPCGKPTFLKMLELISNQVLGSRTLLKVVPRRVTGWQIRSVCLLELALAWHIGASGCTSLKGRVLSDLYSKLVSNFSYGAGSRRERSPPKIHRPSHNQSAPPSRAQSSLCLAELEC